MNAFEAVVWGSAAIFAVMALVLSALVGAGVFGRAYDFRRRPVPPAWVNEGPRRRPVADLRPPLDERDVDLWTRQLQAHDSDDIIHSELGA